MTKKKETTQTTNLGENLKDLNQIAKDMGIVFKNIHASKVTIESAEGKIVIDPESCQATVMKGYESFGINFSIKGKVVEGKLEF
ncbi:MAG: hypothetical protein ABII22_05515 [Candidatus Micrarchaeota archaeon]